MTIPWLDSNKKNHSFVQGRPSICMPVLERNIEPKYNPRFGEERNKILITKAISRAPRKHISLSFDHILISYYLARGQVIKGQRKFLI